MYKDYPPNDSKGGEFMDNFLFNVLASLTASVVVYLISKLFKAKATLAQRVTYELNLNLYLNPK